MQSTRWTSGSLEAIQRQLGAALRAKLHVVTTIIIEGEEAYATGCARVGELLRYALPEAAAGEPVLEAQGAKKSEGALARRCVVGCALGKGRVRVCYVLCEFPSFICDQSEWGAAPFTLAHVTARELTRVPPF